MIPRVYPPQLTNPDPTKLHQLKSSLIESLGP